MNSPRTPSPAPLKLYDHEPLSDDLRDAMHQAMLRLVDILDNHGYAHCGEEPEDIEQVETEPRDGFIPYTDGGWIKRGYCFPESILSTALAFKTIPEPLRERAQLDDDNCFLRGMRRFVDQHPERGPCETLEAAGYLQDELSDSELEEFWDHKRQEELDSAYQVQCGVIYHAARQHKAYDQPAARPSLTFWVCVNTDAPYYRSNGGFLRAVGREVQVDFDLYFQVVPLAELTPAKLSDIRKAMEKCLGV